MSAISLKSITGITSITTPAGVDNQLTLHTNDTTERFKIDEAGNVRVANTFDCVGVSTFRNNLFAQNDLRIAGEIVHISDDNTRIQFPSNDTIAFKTAGSERLRIDSSGRLLVGTNTNNAHANADNVVISGTGNIGLSIMSTDSGRSSIYFGDSSSSPGSYAGYIDFIHSSNSFNIGRGNDNSLTIDSSGRVIIGDTSTGNAFSGGDSLVIGNTSSGTRSGVTLVSANNQDGGIYFSDGTSSGNANVQGQIVYNHSTNNLTFYTQASARLSIGSNGISAFTGSVTATGTIESTGTGAGVGGKFGQIQVGAGAIYNTIQNTVANTPIHLQYNNSGDIKCNEGGGDLRTNDIIPLTNNSANLGSNTRRWANVHTNDLNLSNEGSKNDVDGTWGQYTIQEGQSDLFLINRRSGKRYKFLLQEVD